MSNKAVADKESDWLKSVESHKCVVCGSDEIAHSVIAKSQPVKPGAWEVVGGKKLSSPFYFCEKHENRLAIVGDDGAIYPVFDLDRRSPVDGKI